MRSSRSTGGSGGVGRLEIGMAGGVRVVELVTERMTIGTAEADIVVPDRTVSRLHAAVERVAGGWVIQDLGSRNGTLVNGSPVLGLRALRSGDMVQFGMTTAVFRTRSAGVAVRTEPIAPAPRLTPRERDLLVSLCRPLLTGNLMSPPSTTASIARELVVSESAVKKLLARAYDKFGFVDEERRRARLAVEAIQRGAVTSADLR